MPLPDERRTQKVANLIGKFEQVNKRNVASNANTPQPPPQPIKIPSRMTPSQEPTNAMTLADDFKKDAFHLEAESIPKESRLDTTPSSPGTSREPAVNSEVASETPIQDKAESNSPHQSEMPEPKVDPTPSSTDRLTVPRKTSASLRNASKPSTPAKTITTTPKPSPSTRATPSVAAVKLSSRPSATVTPFVQVQALKPQPTGASVASVSTQAKTTTPLRTQRTLSKTATPPPTTRAAPPTTASNLRAKTPLVTTPRTSTSRPPLTAPTASSLAKARTAPVTGNETPKARTTAATKNPPSAMKPFAGKATATTPSAPKVPQTPARSVKALAPQVPFPSVRKAKSTTNDPPSQNGLRRPRASLPGGGPSAAALAARAKVGANAPPVPSVRKDAPINEVPASAADTVAVVEPSASITTTENGTHDQLGSAGSPSEGEVAPGDAIPSSPSEPLTPERLRDDEAESEGKDVQLDDSEAVAMFETVGLSTPRLDVEETEFRVPVISGEPQKLEDDGVVTRDPGEVEAQSFKQPVGDSPLLNVVSNE